MIDFEADVMVKMIGGAQNEMLFHASKRLWKGTHLQSDHKVVFPTEITTLVGKKIAFKVSIDEYNVKKLLQVFTILHLSGDPEIIESILPSFTPTKDLKSKRTRKQLQLIHLKAFLQMRVIARLQINVLLKRTLAMSLQMERKAVDIKIEKDT
nr:replication protein A 70 kDa DNA-binding subunit B [Tanacetum cinerariifolium]